MTIDSGEPRLLRMSLLSHGLAQNGHRVVYWTSRFDHLRKVDRLPAPGRVDSGEGYEIHCTDRITYYKNVSINRLRHNALVRAEAERAMRADIQRPDVIVADLPTLELAELCALLGQEWNVPVLVSVRDLWPDAFYSLLPAPLRFIGRILFATMENRARNALRLASGIVGISPGYMRWALEKAGRTERDGDAIIPLGYPEHDHSSANEQSALMVLKNRGIDVRKKLVSFVGTFGRSYDLGTVIDAARVLQHRNDLQFVFCGGGEREAEWRAMAGNLPNVVFGGWLARSEIAALLRRTSLGLAAYSTDALQGLPNKFFEYMSYGVPMLSSLTGEAKSEIETSGIGFNYQPGDSSNLAQLIDTALGDPAQLALIAKAAKHRFDQQYRQSQVCSKYVNLVEKWGGSTLQK